MSNRGSSSTVVITGMGIASPVGTGMDEVMSAIELGTRGTGIIEGFDSSRYPARLGAEVRKAGKVVRLNAGADRKAEFIRMAMEELFARYPGIGKYAPGDRYMFMGTGIDYFDLNGLAGEWDGAPGGWEAHCRRSCEVVAGLAEEFGISGGISVNVSACVASAQSIGLAFRMLRSEGGRIAVTGGFDSMLNPLHYMGFYKLGALADWKGDPGGACRSFDRKRSGLVIGEGAMACMMQRLDEAGPGEAMMELAGYASTMDAYLVTDPDPEARALAESAVLAMEDAGISPADVDCVHLHGTGTVKNAYAESRAMERIFPGRWKDIPVYSMKGQVGHLIGACTAVELSAVKYCLDRQEIPAVVADDEPDPDIPLRVVRGTPLRMPIRTILKLNAAFGGQNTAMILRRSDA